MALAGIDIILSVHLLIIHGYTSWQELAKLGKWQAKFLTPFLSGMLWRTGKINHVFIHQVKGTGEQ